jgi:hypothetical protein
MLCGKPALLLTSHHRSASVEEGLRMTNRFGILLLGHHYVPSHASPEEEAHRVAASRRKVVMSRSVGMSRSESQHGHALRLRDQQRSAETAR